MRVERAERPARRGAILDELRAGFRYVSGFAPVRTALLLLALVSTMGMPYTVLMPVIASKTLHGGPHTLGLLMTASGLGAVAGALYLASRRSVVGLGRVMVVATLAFGAGLVAFGLTRSLWTALILQTVVEEHLRGRVMSFYTMAFLGTAPIGSLLAGVVADRVGASATVLLGGVACIAGGLWLALRLPTLREQVRPIYVERGILSSVQADAGTARGVP